MDETRLGQLRDYLVEARRQGETYDQIRERLLTSGWSDQDVNEYLPAAWQQSEAIVAPAPAAPPVVQTEAPFSQPPAYAPPQPVSPGAYTPPVTPPTVTTAPPAYPPSAQPSYGAPPTYQSAYGGQNTSGTQGPVPAEVEAMGWSWGGFGLNWIWGIGNRVYIALLALIPCVNLFVAIWLGLQGHKLAWQNRRFDSFEQYRDTMKAWNTWGLIIFLVSVVINIISAIVQVASQQSGS